jgi:hypothetical protein
MKRAGESLIENCGSPYFELKVEGNQIVGGMKEEIKNAELPNVDY